MSSVVLITGAATGIGNLTARALAAAGHTVYASMRDVRGRNAARAEELRALGRREGHDLRVVELDVQSEASAEAAVATVLDEAGRLDTVVHNAGHLYVGYVEAFTPAPPRSSYRRSSARTSPPSPPRTRWPRSPRTRSDSSASRPPS
ncbi:hypothetical protein AQJ30_25725 [Streptomyces longwoodensis]|uniref:Short-chain dehydrogenase n=1 Tax=Streptomyces longwoodensis TaxID=68231 RepID=A0A101QT37_9ACTN|nr:SDR family NAD(P)-dependent oxidoreductase [Streptomyces longwoodensis]KUN35523.1 hypothetical protein AQJ30_25725 [Streptomyces longwoodensis]